MLGLSLDEAKNIALVAATAFAILAIAAIWVMKTIVQKVLVALLLIMLAFAAWSQRESLQECAEQVQANVSSSVADATAPDHRRPARRSTTPGPTSLGESADADDDVHVLRRRRDHSVTSRRRRRTLPRRRRTDSLGVEKSTLATITGAKAVANTALRWIPPFLPTLERAFGVSAPPNSRR